MHQVMGADKITAWCWYAQRLYRASCRVELSTDDFQKCVRLRPVPSGGSTFIVIDAVMQRSSPWEAGLRPGQRLSAISDANRVDQVWQLNGTSSFRFVRQSIRMQIAPKIIVEVEDSNLLEEEKNELVRLADDAVAKEQSLDKLDSDNSAMSSISALDSMLSSESSCDEDVAQGLTVAEKLEQQYQCALTLRLESRMPGHPLHFHVSRALSKNM
jgi:hypothetical protein